MQRDMDLVRQILRTLEDRPAESNKVGVEIEGASRSELYAHLKIMEDAGLVDGVSLSSTSVSCKRLTWSGHEFLDASRNDTVWNKAKDIAIEKTGGLSLEALMHALKMLIAQAFT